MTISGVVAFGASAEVLGRLIWLAWPGVAALVLGLRLHRGGRPRFQLTMVVCAFWILGALGLLGTGDPRGLTQLALPVAVLLLITRRPARDFFAA
jgi:hypothetical protein